MVLRNLFILSDNDKTLSKATCAMISKAKGVLPFLQMLKAEQQKPFP
jgi:hypothetical protein